MNERAFFLRRFGGERRGVPGPLWGPTLWARANWERSGEEYTSSGPQAPHLSTQTTGPNMLSEVAQGTIPQALGFQ